MSRAVLITGASSGIGAALAREFAARGADLALAARRTDRLDELAKELTARGRRALVLACDVTRDGDLEAAAARTREALGGIDVVVANAGFGVVGPAEALTLADYRRQFETNVFGVLRTLYATLGDLKRSRGVFAIIGSVSGHLATPNGTPYAMSKFAVRALAEGLRHELRPAGVAVTLLSPGFVESEIRFVDNDGRLRAGGRDIVPPWLRMRTATAARQIATAIERRQRERIVTGHGKALVFLARHAPGLMSGLVGLSGYRGRSHSGKA
ncbi:MAG TPA: SDR family NAD(P)-dependent oxidoreductase [Terriglobales bacterium]|nr:SDR family NAD(P)-dependent oxidoreductase [Terriglobales bacterium]